MPEAAERENNHAVDPSRLTASEMAPLVGRIRQLLTDRHDAISACQAPYDLATLEEEFGFAERGRGNPEVILAEDMAVELGHPSTASQSIVLTSYRPELISHGRISIVGPDVGDMERHSRRPFGQLVMLALRGAEAPDPFQMDNTQYLIRRLPGYMVRSVPGKLWVRVSRKALEGGFTLKTIGSALVAAYTSVFEAVTKVEVVFVTSCPEDVEALTPISHEANILAGKHKKLLLSPDGEVECSDLSCSTCEEKPICDNLRDIVIKRRLRKQ